MDANVKLGYQEAALGKALIKYGRLTNDLLSIRVGRRLIEKGVVHLRLALGQRKRQGPITA